MTTPLITPVMGISWPCILGKECFDMLKSIGFGDLVRLFSSSRRSDRVYLGWCVWDSVWGSLGCKLQDNQSRLTRASVLLARLLALASKSTSLSSAVNVWVQGVQHDLFSSGVFLPYFSMLILLLPLLGLGSKSTSLSPGFCVRRPRQYDTICWKLNLISGFFVFSGYLFGRMESINVAGVFQEAGEADSTARTRSQV